MRHLVMIGLVATGPAWAEEAPEASPPDDASPPEAVDVLVTMDRVFEVLASFIHVHDDESVELGDGLLHWGPGGRVAMFRDWVVVDGDDLSLGRGWLTVHDGQTTIAGWTLPFGGGSVDADDVGQRDAAL